MERSDVFAGNELHHGSLAEKLLGAPDCLAGNVGSRRQIQKTLYGSPIGDCKSYLRITKDFQAL